MATNGHKLERYERIRQHLSKPADGSDPRRRLKQIRDRAMFALLARGLTTGQIEALDIGQIDLAAGLVHVQTPRAKYPWVVELEASDVEALRTWKTARALLHPTTTAVFVTLNTNESVTPAGERLGAHSMRCMARTYAAQAA